MTEAIWFDEERQAGKPPERISIAEWAERKRVLTNAAAKGPYRCEMVPALRPLMGFAKNPFIEEIVLAKSAQIGGTDAVINIVGYYVDQDPSPIMFVLADADTAIEEMSRQRIQPMFQDSDQLSHLPDKDQWTKQELLFRNGSRITFGWASSVGRLASRPYRIVIFDEIDKDGYGQTTNEADSISLGKERTDTFANALILLLSTPTIEGSRLDQQLKSCDIVYDNHAPCPHCSQYQPLRWSLKYSTGCIDGQYRDKDGVYRQIGGVVWEGGRQATREQIEAARYVCGECGSLWTTIEKNHAVQQAIPVPRTEPTGQERKVGLHVNRLYSLFPGGRLERMVGKWIEAVNSGDLKQVQGFVNSALAEPFKQVTAQASQSDILQARTDLPPRTVPESAVCLTCGVDNQKYGFWFTVRAWAPGFTSWLIDYGFLASWEDVESLLFETAYPYEHDDSQSLSIWRVGIDIGGGQFEEGMSMTEEVYWWVRQNGVGRGCRVWCTKGASNTLASKVQAGKPLDKTPSGKPIPGGLQIVSLDTGKLKDAYHYRLQQTVQNEPQAAYLHSEVGEDYAKQIRSEQKRVDRKGVESWIHVRGENHLLDCEAIAHALVDPEWPGGGLNLYKPPKSKPKPPKSADPQGSPAPTRKTPNWFNQRR